MTYSCHIANISVEGEWALALHANESKANAVREHYQRESEKVGLRCEGQGCVRVSNDETTINLDMVANTTKEEVVVCSLELSPASARLLAKALMHVAEVAEACQERA